jgi:hypothetical protein
MGRLTFDISDANNSAAQSICVDSHVVHPFAVLDHEPLQEVDERYVRQEIVRRDRITRILARLQHRADKRFHRNPPPFVQPLDVHAVRYSLGPSPKSTWNAVMVHFTPV